MYPRKRNINSTRPARRKLQKKVKRQEKMEAKRILFFAVRLTHGRETRKVLFPGHHVFTKHHNQTTDHAQVAQEEIEIENQPISEALDNHDG